MFFSSFRFILCPAANMLEKLLNIIKNSGNLKQFGLGLTPHQLSEHRHFPREGQGVKTGHFSAVVKGAHSVWSSEQ